jgi:hypothetical protein
LRTGRTIDASRVVFHRGRRGVHCEGFPAQAGVLLVRKSIAAAAAWTERPESLDIIASHENGRNHSRRGGQ